LLLARLFSQPANLLVMDEPTNDLDVETLELLEELLNDYDGTLLLVSHDRAFLDNVVTSTLVFEGDAVVKEYVGGYSDWLRQRSPSTEGKPSASVDKMDTQSLAEKTSATPKQKPRKLSYKEQRELEALPARLEALEVEQNTLQAEINEPAFYQQDQDTITQTLQRLESVGNELEVCFQRWEELESQQED
jgi:ATP-binding cassette subfamily F protein uup